MSNLNKTRRPTLGVRLLNLGRTRKSWHQYHTPADFLGMAPDEIYDVSRDTNLYPANILDYSIEGVSEEQLKAIMTIVKWKRYAKKLPQNPETLETTRLTFIAKSKGELDARVQSMLQNAALENAAASQTAMANERRKHEEAKDRHERLKELGVRGTSLFEPSDKASKDATEAHLKDLGTEKSLYKGGKRKTLRKRKTKRKKSLWKRSMRRRR